MKHRQLFIAGFTAFALSFSSCTSVNPYTGEEKASSTLKGSAIGALSGAALGAMIGNNRGGGKSRKGAIAGALGGILVGAGIGKYMDQQEDQIRQQLSGTGVSVTRQGNNLILNMPSDITFGTGKSSILPRFGSTLNGVGVVLNKYGKTLVSVTGHTDSDGAAGYNQSLSVQRANSVANYLAGRGVAGSRLITEGRGESQPIASNETQAGKAQNRRVELYIIPQNNQF